MISSKGPWSVAKQGDKLVISSAEGKYICHLSEDMYSPERVKSGEMEANFRLMARAPELLAKYELFMNILKGHINTLKEQGEPPHEKTE